MKIDQMRALVAIAREGNFGRAAASLYITQPALSMQIKALEQEIDTRLFERDTRRVRPTEAGNVLLRRATVILAELEAARQDMDDLKGLARGRVTIASSDTVTRYLLTPVLARFMAENPDIEVTIANKTTPEAVAMVRGMEADVGFVTMPLVEKRLKARSVWEYREVAMCAAGHPLARRKKITVAELGSSRLLLLERGTQSRALVERMFSAAGIVVNPGMELASVEIQKDLARLGLGVAVVPSYAVEAERSDGRSEIVEIESSLATRTIGLALRSAGPVAPAVAAFCRLVK